MDRDNTPCFVGYGECGHIKAVSVDEPQRKEDNAKFVASLVRDGLRLEKLSVSDVRKAKWCDCPKPSKPSAASSARKVE